MRFDPYASDPDAYRHLSALAVHLFGSDLDPGLRSLVELRVSQINGCAFCLRLHTATAHHAGVPQEKLDQLAGFRDAPAFTPNERAALALAEEMARSGDGRVVADETWSAVRKAFNDAEIASLLYTIGLIRLWNTLNVAVEFPADGPLPRLT
jgi:AhpD family alkylhydroperoxidase